MRWSPSWRTALTSNRSGHRCSRLRSPRCSPVCVPHHVPPLPRPLPLRTAPPPFGGVGLMCQLAGVFSSVGLGGGLLDRQAAVWRRDTVPGSVGGARRARPAASVAPSPVARSWASLVTPRPCSAWRGRNGEPGIWGFGFGGWTQPSLRGPSPSSTPPGPDAAWFGRSMLVQRRGCGASRPRRCPRRGVCS